MGEEGRSGSDLNRIYGGLVLIMLSPSTSIRFIRLYIIILEFNKMAKRKVKFDVFIYRVSIDLH